MFRFMFMYGLYGASSQKIAISNKYIEV
jgi:hypothetical protein